MLDQDTNLYLLSLSIKGLKGLEILLNKMFVLFNEVYLFCVGGDGPKRALLEDVCEQCKLQERVKFLGKLKHEKVRDVSL